MRRNRLCLALLAGLALALAASTTAPAGGKLRCPKHTKHLAGCLPLTQDGGVHDLAGFAPDGSRVLYATSAGNDVLTATTTAPVAVVNVSRSAATDRQPAWSPDGRVAFVSNRPDETGATWFQVYVADALGEPRALTALPGVAGSPSFTPAGESVVFADNWDGVDGVYAVPVAGGPVARLADGTTPTVSPDGTRIAFARAGVLTVAAADGSGTTALAPLTRGTGASFSPDGRTLLFVRAGDVYTVAVDGGPERRLTADGVSSHPTWAPDGARITFTTRRDGDGDVYVMRADGSQQLDVTRSPADEYDSAFSPDGARLAWVRDGDILVADAP